MSLEGNPPQQLKLVNHLKLKNKREEQEGRRKKEMKKKSGYGILRRQTSSYMNVLEISGVDQEFHQLVVTLHDPCPISSHRAVNLHNRVPVDDEVPIQGNTFPAHPSVKILCHCSSLFTPALDIVLQNNTGRRKKELK